MSYQKPPPESIERREQLARRAFESLCDEWRDAAAHDPRREIPTPGHHHTKEQLVYLVLDELSGDQGEEMLAEMVKALHQSEGGQVLLEKMAQDHARYHCADRVMELMENDDPGA